MWFKGGRERWGCEIRILPRFKLSITYCIYHSVEHCDSVTVSIICHGGKLTPLICLRVITLDNRQRVCVV